MSIFDDSFEERPAERRNALLPLWLKIYIWVGMILGAYTTIHSSIQMGIIYNNYAADAIAGTIAPEILLFLMTFLVWRKISWAIRFNWLIVVLWLMMITGTLLVDPTLTMTVILPIIFFIPYWLMLFSIQHKWENPSPRHL